MEHAVASAAESRTVYGALPPEARRQQAALFNGPQQPPPPPPQPQPPHHQQQQQQKQKQKQKQPADGAAEAAGSDATGDGGGGGGGAEGRREAGAEGSPSPPHPRRRGQPHGRAPPRPAAGGAGPPPPPPHHQQHSPQQGGAAPGHGSLSSFGGGAGASAGPDGSGPQSGSGSGFGPGPDPDPDPASPAGPSRVLVASDAIGMGLNLNIRRVVFTSLTKYDGKAVRPLQASEVRQIAGRAGRFSSAHPAGYVTCLHPRDLPALHRALQERPQPLQRACLLPRHVWGLGAWAPADMDDPAVAAALLRFARLFCGAGVVGHEAIATGGRPLPQDPPRSESELKWLEELFRVYDLYVWLGFRLPYAFTGRQEAEAARAVCGGLIEEGLDRLAAAGWERGGGGVALGRRSHHRQEQHGQQEEEEQQWQQQEQRQ
ncbi:ATP-dependent RNA helicase SUPV3L1, mitochondrial [Tetrabaena socialis]|uniref:ATP-dependent RNA helicase SUPV3L1, mitochondrial n=1 Tax=Tetrabaena socialis TaxID=47790 RepID=A0A2J7ZKB8_9CHLO|nr:ATP-dependent RNA helicase SUPV3L1, mitochondrial [Tetrabaena socialis]|eukprot:PNH00709.1 ATP-dependent RNA helicase SUPV3L1, mitochondrial [Tetrabaena socialis]